MERLLLIFVLLSAFLQANGANKDRILVTGSSTVAPLILEIAKKYEKEPQGTRVDVQTGGSSRGINDQRRGLAQIGMVSRALKNSEKDLVGHLVARDGVGIIVHKSNHLTNLSDQQVSDIFRGKLKNWKELGGRDADIVVVNKAEGRSTLEVFLKHFKLKNSEIKASVIIGDNEQGIKTVAGNPNAIGYVSVGTAEFNSKSGIPIRALSLNGQRATVENVRQGHYPLVRELNLVVYGSPKSSTSNFIQFAKSSKVKEIVEQFYFVPVSN